MSRAVPEVPVQMRDLITRLRHDDEKNGTATLSGEQVGQAREWLARIIVDSEALRAHLGLLQSLYPGSRFRGTLPRRFWVEGVPPPRAEAPVGFRHNQPLEQEKALAIAQGGLVVVSDAELAALLLNPLALWDLSDLISFLHPASWRPRMKEAGRELMQRHGLRATIPPPTTGTASG
jgi:hypothetical protein